MFYPDQYLVLLAEQTVSKRDRFCALAACYHEGALANIERLLHSHNLVFIFFSPPVPLDTKPLKKVIIRTLF